MTILRGDLKDGAQWTEPAEIEVGAHNGSPQKGAVLGGFQAPKNGVFIRQRRGCRQI